MVAAVDVAEGIVGAAFADFPVGVDGDLPSRLGHQPDGLAFAFTQLPAHRVDQLVSGAAGQRVQMLDQLCGWPRRRRS